MWTEFISVFVIKDNHNAVKNRHFVAALRTSRIVFNPIIAVDFLINSTNTKNTGCSITKHDTFLIQLFSLRFNAAWVYGYL